MYNCIFLSVLCLAAGMAPIPPAIDTRCVSGDCKNGKGVLEYETGARYSGTFRKNCFDGNGTFNYADGGTYTGEFRSCMRHGRGTLTLPDGSRYVGEWRNDERHGSGAEYSPSGLAIRTGRWVKGQYAGK